MTEQDSDGIPPGHHLVEDLDWGTIIVPNEAHASDYGPPGPDETPCQNCGRPYVVQQAAAYLAAEAKLEQVRIFANGIAIRGRTLGDVSMERAGLDLLIILESAREG